jgi:NAD(P)-dependent dehydrogenase (short-subunit alcohol dehydrogenase family)
MNGRCKSKSAANSKNQLFASIFDFADAFRITFEAALCPVNAYSILIYSKRGVMKLNLEGKKALVTGSSSGIGESIAKALAQEGVEVVVHGRNEKELKRVSKEISKTGGTCLYAAGDLSTDAGAERVAKTCIKEFGSIDILINNAGAFPERTWSDTSPTQWNELFNTNLFSAVRMINLLVPQMNKKKWGRIINISSCVGIRPFATLPDYAASKGALLNITVSLAMELATTGITVNSVSPGAILTPGVDVFFKKIAKEYGWGPKWNDIEKHAVAEFLKTPIPRFGKPEEVAALTAFLCSPAAAYITASNIRVDGGTVGTVN